MQPTQPPEPPRNEYLVVWAIDMEARSSEEAAAGAREAQRAPDSQATHFTVINKRSGFAYCVDNGVMREFCCRSLIPHMANMR